MISFPQFRNSDEQVPDNVRQSADASVLPSLLPVQLQILIFLVASV